MVDAIPVVDKKQPIIPATARLSKGKLSYMVVWIGFWTLYTVVGMWSKAQDPDIPSFRSVHTNLLDPWATWCPQTHGFVAGCYGTSWNHIGGPYSIVWYWFMIAIGLGGLVSFTQALFALHVVFVGFLYRTRQWLLGPYMFTSAIFLVGYPQNMPILFLEVLGFWNPVFVFLALIVKLPFGAPPAVWRYMLTSPQSVQDPSNWFVYTILVAWALGALTWKPFLRKIWK